VPNPIKVFLWRACTDILPTKENLQKRGIIKDSLCYSFSLLHIFFLIGNVKCRSAIHILWNWPSASIVWGAIGKKVQKIKVGEVSFIDVMEN